MNIMDTVITVITAVVVCALLVTWIITSDVGIHRKQKILNLPTRRNEGMLSMVS